MWKMLLGNVDFKKTSFPFLLYFLALYSFLQKIWPSSPGWIAASSRNIKVSSSSSRTCTYGHQTVCLLKIPFYHWSLICYKDQTSADFEEIQQLLLHLRPKFLIITVHTSINFSRIGVKNFKLLHFVFKSKLFDAKRRWQRLIRLIPKLKSECTMK